MGDFLLNVFWFLLKGFLFLIAFSLILAVPITIFNYVRFRGLAKKRAGLSICQFARSFDYRRVDTKIIRAAYEEFQNWAGPGVKDFPVMAADNISKLYGMEGEDLDDVARELAERTGRRWEELEMNPLYGQVTTVGDLVLFLNRQPRANV